jgi:hypothetical protein
MEDIFPFLPGSYLIRVFSERPEISRITCWDQFKDAPHRVNVLQLRARMRYAKRDH